MSNSDILQAIGPLARLLRRTPPAAAPASTGRPEDYYREGLRRMRAGDAESALQAFDKALILEPRLADAAIARAELLDAAGRAEEARADYERARRLWSELPPGAADRRYLFRRRGHFAFEIESYELVRSNVRNKVLPQIAHANALLLVGRLQEALDGYDSALKVKPDMPDLLALKGEALAALGRHAEAIELFDRVLGLQPADGETLNSRGISRMALGQVDAANEDWKRQLAGLPAGQSAARGCVAMRQGNYEAAFAEFAAAMAKEPGNPYWPLYRLTAGRLIGAVPDAIAPPANDHWPAPLLALRGGQATEQEALGLADTPARRAEALFQLGVLALAGNPAAARTYWGEIVERSDPALIEFAAARNELARLGG